MIKLYNELLNGTYRVGRSIYFIQNQPVKREIFAGDFRNRIIHHLLYNNISPIFEKEFIYDSYSCRKGKGTSFGVKRVEKFVRSCSNNYTKDCYILKLDVSGYFMSMDKDLLLEKIERILYAKKEKLEIDFDFIRDIIKEIIYNDPTKNGIFKGKRSIGYFYEKIQVLNSRLESNDFKLDNKLKVDFLSIINSYLGFLRHHKSYTKRKKLLLKVINACYWNYFYISNNYTKTTGK